MTRPTAVFDLDGTLIDTAPDLLDSLNHCLLGEGMDPVRAHRPAPSRRFRRPRHDRARLCRTARSRLRRTNSNGYFDVFLEHYRANIPGRSRPSPAPSRPWSGSLPPDTAGGLHQQVRDSSSVTLLTALGLAPRLAAICGGDSFAFRKPDPRHLLETIEQAGGDPLNAVMVGDSRTDIDTAKAAGVPVVAVDFGYTDQPVQVFAPTRVISHFDELTTESLADSFATASGTPPRHPRRNGLTRAGRPCLTWPGNSPLYPGALRAKARARSSAGEHSLHTGGVTGSIPVAPTMISSTWQNHDFLCPDAAQKHRTPN